VSALETTLPVQVTAVALPIGTTPAIFPLQPPPTQVNSSLSALTYSPAIGGAQGSPRGVVARGVLYITNGATAGTLQPFLSQNGVGIGVNPPALTVAANAVIAIPFELASLIPIAPSFGGSFLGMSVGAIVTGDAMKVTLGFMHYWTV
jgi:hypothetical protein